MGGGTPLGGGGQVGGGGHWLVAFSSISLDAVDLHSYLLFLLLSLPPLMLLQLDSSSFTIPQHVYNCMNTNNIT